MGSGALSRKTYAIFSGRLGHLSITNRKLQEGFAAYERNTGEPHPLCGSLSLSRRGSTGADALTDNDFVSWYGDISVGTPLKSFSGMTFLRFKLVEVTL